MMEKKREITIKGLLQAIIPVFLLIFTTILFIYSFSMENKILAIIIAILALAGFILIKLRIYRKVERSRSQIIFALSFVALIWLMGSSYAIYLHIMGDRSISLGYRLGWILFTGLMIFLGGFAALYKDKIDKEIKDRK